MKDSKEKELVVLEFCPEISAWNFGLKFRPRIPGRNFQLVFSRPEFKLEDINSVWPGQKFGPADVLPLIVNFYFDLLNKQKKPFS